MDPTTTTAPAARTPVRGRAPDRTEIPAPLQTALADAGWRHPTERVFRTRVPLPDGGTRVVLVAAWGGGYLALLTAVGRTTDGELPAISTEELGGHVLHAIGDVVMLLRLVPAGPPGPGLAEITEQVRHLATCGASVAAALRR